MVRKRLVIYVVISLLFIWTVWTYYFIMKLSSQKKKNKHDDSTKQIREKLEQVESAIQTQIAENKRLLDFLNKKLSEDDQFPSSASIFSQSFASDTIAVLVFACNRPFAIKNHLSQLLKLRPSKEQFPVIVSLDCNHAETREAVLSFGDQVSLIQQPDQSDYQLPPKQKKFVGYYKIARHYRWALNYTFFNFDHQAVIITEDDLDLSVDFFEYFKATYTLLRLDTTLWCVSAWNDNGKQGMIENDSRLLYRTDFFPGLGWMLRRDVWQEFEPKWPLAFWDDWLRGPDQRRDRACIRPEISRTAMSRHGKIGVSRGQYFEKHLKYIQLNTEKVEFTKLDLSYLLKDFYDVPFVKRVYSAPSVALSELLSGRLSNGGTLPSIVRIGYDSAKSYKETAKSLKLMDDFRSGVPRTAYRGIVSFMHNNIRVFIAPPPDWKNYDLAWN